MQVQRCGIGSGNVFDGGVILLNKKCRVFYIVKKNLEMILLYTFVGSCINQVTVISS